MKLAILLIIAQQLFSFAWATPTCENSARKPEVAAVNLLLSGLKEGPLDIEDLETFVNKNKWSNPYANYRRTLKGLALFDGFSKLSQQLNAEQRLLVKVRIREVLIQERQTAENVSGARNKTKWIVGDPTILRSFESIRGQAADFKITGDTTRSVQTSIDGRPVFVETYVKAENGQTEYFDVLFDPFHPDPLARVFEIRKGNESPTTKLKIWEDNGLTLLIELGQPFAFDLKSRKLLTRAPFTDDEFEMLPVRDIYQAGSKTVVIRQNSSLTLIEKKGTEAHTRTFSEPICQSFKFHAVGGRHFVTCLPMQRNPLYIFDIEAGEFLPPQQTLSNEKMPPMFAENGKVYFAEFTRISTNVFGFVQVNVDDRNDRKTIAETPFPKHEGIFESNDGLHFFVEHFGEMTVGDLHGGHTFTISNQEGNPIKKTFQWNGEPYGYRMNMFGKFEIQSLRSGHVEGRYKFEPLATSHYIFTYQGQLYGFFTQYNNPSLLMRLEADTSR